MNLKKWLDIPTVTSGVWSLKTSLEKFGLKRIIKPKVQNPSSNFQKRDLIYSRIIR